MKKREKKLQAQSILATVVMGMNLVNAAAPAAALAAAEQPEPLPKQAVSEAQQEDLQTYAYEALPTLAGYVDEMIFSKAEAQNYSVGSGESRSLTSTDYADTVYIEGGGTCTIDKNKAKVTVMEGGSLAIGEHKGIYDNTPGPLIVSGGKVDVTSHAGGGIEVWDGNVNIVSNRVQTYVHGGTCIIDENSSDINYVYGGTGIIKEIVSSDNNQITQEISGGTGIVSVMNASNYNEQVQHIKGGRGIVGTMSNGWQWVWAAGAEGHIDVMSGGEQLVNAGSGSIDTMYGGTQYASAGRATIGTMYNGGSQNVGKDANAEIVIMSGGKQQVTGTGNIVKMINGVQYADGTANIETMINGNQTIGWKIAGSGAVGTIQNMSNGMQIIYSGHTGIIDTMDGGYQYAGYNAAAGNGIIKSMNSGQQYVYDGGSGTILKMAGGGAMQIIGMTGSAAVGSIEVMETGTQIIGYQNGNFATGSITSMNDGVQIIGHSGGSGIGTIAMMNNGSQVINNAGTGMVTSLLGGEQIVNNGAKAINTTIAGGTQKINSGGIAVSTTIKAGQQIVSVGAVVSGAVLSGGVQQVYDGTNLHDITFEGGTQAVMDGATVSGMQVDSGMQAVTSGGTATDTTVNSGGVQYIEAGAVISGTVLDGGTLRLAQADSDYTLNNTLTINNGVLDLTDGAGLKRNLRAVPVYQKLTMSDLQGSGGDIHMDTDLANNDGDKIIVKDSNIGTGTYGVYVTDQSIVTDKEVTGHLLLVDDKSKKLKFKGMTANNGGLWDTTPILNEETNQWYLTKIIKTANDDTQVLLAGVDNSYALWRSTNDSLRSRLGALGNGSERADGIWARTQAGRFSGFGYEGRYNLYQLGYDQKADARSTYGFAVDYGDGTGDYTKGSGKDKLTAFSLYGVWQGKRGAYTNVTARAGMFDTDLKSYGDFPDKASYKEHAYSISVEYGQRFDYQQGLFFEPQAQFTLGHLSGISYTTDRGANGYIEGLNSAIGRIGFIMGQKVKNGSDIYLKADLLHEFAGKRDLQLTSDAGGTNDILSKHNDYGDTWFELGLGANIKLSKDSSFYGEVERGFGGDINKKWSVNAGLRFEF